jgi:enamine deaminase RidA (YjgF/YER057c/UK114 family)
VWRNVIAQLHAAGMSVANLVKVTVFLSSRDYALVNMQHLLHSSTGSKAVSG